MIGEHELEGFELHNVDVQLPPLKEDKIQNWLKRVALSHGKNIRWISLVFCSDDYLLEVNQLHLDHDYYTDIISFPFSYEPISCELFISLDRVKDNAKIEGVEWHQELLRVMAHGLLHMIGFDDDTPDKKTNMRFEESRAMHIWEGSITSES